MRRGVELLRVFVTPQMSSIGLLSESLDGHKLTRRNHQIAKLGERGDIGCIATVGNGQPGTFQIGLSGIERKPTTSHENLKPGVHVHRFESVQIAGRHTRGDA